MKRQMLLVNGRGFSLIEALVALAIMSFGLLAVANFQISLVSGSSYNKARSEAMALAQEKLDELRNYVIEPQLVANLEDNAVTASDLFPDNVTAATYPQSGGAVTPESINGTNTQFQRQWTVSTATGLSNLRNIVVTVSWVDSKGVNQQVQLESEVSWKNPRGTADLGNAAEPAVPNPTGKAKLGEGTVTQTEKDGGTNNGDGTTTVIKGNDRLLVNNTDTDNDGNYDVVLTLTDACLTQSGTCTNFVKISGRVFIDLGSSTITPSEVSVLASDAAYCAQKPAQLSDQFILDINPVDGTPDTYYGNGDGNADYKYFDYTCYLGGGWYGNIGLLFHGNNVNNNDYACVGDPSATSAATDAWKHYELAKRRVYRGMTHEVVDGTAVTDGGGNVIYYTKGIADATAFPDSNWPARNHGHDYVIMRATGQSVTSADCITPMTRPDADTSNSGYPMFSNAAGDFVCLNEDNDVNSYVYLDTLRAGFAAQDTCPYDPSRPPSARRTISGTISAESDLTGIEVNTSDGPGNCTLTLGNPTTTATYTCDIYLWQDETSNLNPKPLIPWEGEIQFSQIPYRMVLSATTLTFNTANSNAVSSNTTATTVNGYDKQNAMIRGTISAPANDLVNDPSGNVTVTSTEQAPYDQCTVTPGVDASNQPDGTVDYVCDVFGPDQNTGWTGTVSVTMPSGDYNCPVSSRDFTAIITDQIADFNCTGPFRRYNISGTLVDGSNPITTQLSVTPTAVALGGTQGTCSTQRNAGNTDDVDYSCDVLLDTRVAPSWEGTVTLTPVAGFWCDAAGADAVFPVTTSSNVTLATVTCRPDAADVIIEGSVFVPLSYVSFRTLTTYTYVGPGLGAYDMSCNYVGPGLGDTDCVFATETDDVKLNSVTMNGTVGSTSAPGTCNILSNTTVWAPPTPAEQGTWHKFTCKTDKAINRNKTWTGSVTVGISSANPSTAWQLCGVGGHNTVTTSTAGDLATVDYPNPGIVPGTTVDNVFLGLTYSTATTCAPYEPTVSPPSLGPWTWSDGTNSYSVNLPWTPTYVP